MELTTLATFSSLEKAQEVHKRLESAGIHSFVRDESEMQRLWFLSHPEAAEKVQVQRRDVDNAMRLLDYWQGKDGLLDEAHWCPECHSANIEYPQMPRKFVTPILAELLMAAGVFPRQFYCCECHHTWAKTPEKEVSRDLLGWPNDSRIFHPENEPKTPLS